MRGGELQQLCICWNVFIHYILSANAHDIPYFCLSSCWCLSASVSPHLTHMFRVIKYFLGNSVWWQWVCRIRKLGSFAMLHQVAGICVFHSYSCTHTLDRHTHTHRITKSFSVLPAKLVSPFIPGCRCLWVKYLWKIAMIGFIMLPQVSKMEMSLVFFGEKKSLFKILAC